MLILIFMGDCQKIGKIAIFKMVDGTEGEPIDMDLI